MGIQEWACVDYTLSSDKQNGCNSTGRVVTVGNTIVVSKTTLQTSVEKYTCGSEFVAHRQVIDAVMTVRD